MTFVVKSNLSSLSKIRAYNLIDMGHDTLSANQALGHPTDARDYYAAGQILNDLGVSKVSLLTNNPSKISGLENQGIQIVERIPCLPSGWDHSHSHPTPDGEDQCRSSRNLSSRDKLQIPDTLQECQGNCSDEGSQPKYLNPAPHSSLSLYSLHPMASLLNRDLGTALFCPSPPHSEDEYLRHRSVSSPTHPLHRRLTAKDFWQERDAYLKTKVEKMGHLLRSPAHSATQP